MKKKGSKREFRRPPGGKKASPGTFAAKIPRRRFCQSAKPLGGDRETTHGEEQEEKTFLSTPQPGPWREYERTATD